MSKRGQIVKNMSNVKKVKTVGLGRKFTHKDVNFDVTYESHHGHFEDF